MTDNKYNDDDLEIPEEPAWKRWGVSVLQGAISSAPLPFVSGVVGNVFGELAQERIHQRQEKLLKEIVSGLETLRQQYADLTVEKLATNDVFVTTMLQAVEMAERAYQQEKLDALRNIVLHTALASTSSPDWEYKLRLPFLSLVRDLTPCEMQLLMFFHDPRQYGVEGFYQHERDTIPSPAEIVMERIPCLENQTYLYIYIVQALDTRGLIDKDPQGRGMPYTPKTSGIGDEFIWFIGSPLSDQQ